MILCGIGDEAGNQLKSQIEATRRLGWQHLEMRNVQVDGFAKANLHEIPEAAFENVVEQLAEAGLRVHCFGSTILNWSKKSSIRSSRRWLRLAGRFRGCSA